MNDRPLPHDLDAERALLGGVLVAPEYLPWVREIAPEEFYRAAHASIWRAVLALDAAGSAIDLLTLRGRLEATGALESVGRSYLLELTDGVPRAANVEHYAAIVRDKADRRARYGAAMAMAEACYQDADEAATTTEQVEATLATIDRRKDAGHVLDVDGQIAALEADLEQDKSGVRLTLGLPAIDQEIEGVRPGEVLDIWARPGIGKTLLLCHVAISVVEWQHAAIFSLEMPAPQIVRRLARMAFGLSNFKLRQYGVPVDHYRARFERLTLDATAGLTVAQIEARVRRLQQTGVPVRAVFVDHLHLLGGDRKLSSYDRTSTHARDLKDMAKRLGVVVVRLVQVSREAGGDGSKELHLGSARDSGAVEESADYVLGWRRLDRSTTHSAEDRQKFRDVLFGKVIKHRNGAPPEREFGYRIDDQTIVLREDLSARPEAADSLASIAAMAGRGRR